MVDLDELKRLAEGASPGKWEARQRDWGYPERDGGEVRRLWGIDAGGVNIAGLTIFSLDERDAAYIAAMHPDTAKKLIAVATVLELVRDCSSQEWQQADGKRMGATDNQGRRMWFITEDVMQAARTALEELK